jgi:hypothetical protein
VTRIPAVGSGADTSMTYAYVNAGQRACRLGNGGTESEADTDLVKVKERKNETKKGQGGGGGGGGRHDP